MVGVAPNAPIGNVRVIDAAEQTNEGAVVCGLNWAIANGFLVVNMSFSVSTSETGPSCVEGALHQAICNAVSQGVSVVVSAGNFTPAYDETDLVRGDLATQAPARYDETIAVTGFNSLDQHPLGPAPGYAPSTTFTAYQWCNVGGPAGRDDYYGDYSKFARSTDDIAHTVNGPGSCVYSTDNTGNYRYANGTSLAAPAIAGAVALCKETGRCSARDAYQTKSVIINDAASYNNGNLSHGFYGDPARPVSGRYYGWLPCLCNY